VFAVHYCLNIESRIPLAIRGISHYLYVDGLPVAMAVDITLYLYWRIIDKTIRPIFT